MTKLLSIDGDQFEMPSAEEKGFIEGHVCTAVEAKNLYQTWCEGVGNNMRASVKKAKEEGKSADDIRALVSEYASKYTFATPGVGRTIRDPVERECDKIAKEFIRAKLAETGRKMNVTPDGMTDDEWAAKLEANIEKVATHPDTIKLAKRRVAERQKAGQSALEGVDL